jgi:hypothetical protein
MVAVMMMTMPIVRSSHGEGKQEGTDEQIHGRFHTERA